MMPDSSSGSILNKLSQLRKKILALPINQTSKNALRTDIGSLLDECRYGRLSSAASILDRIEHRVKSCLNPYIPYSTRLSVLPDILSLKKSLLLQEKNHLPLPQKHDFNALGQSPTMPHVTVSVPGPAGPPGPPGPMGPQGPPGLDSRLVDTELFPEDEDNLDFFPPGIHITVVMGNQLVFHGQWYKESQGFLQLVLNADTQDYYKRGQIVYLNINNIHSLG